jgi:hypothetical protein
MHFCLFCFVWFVTIFTLSAIPITICKWGITRSYSDWLVHYVHMVDGYSKGGKGGIKGPRGQAGVFIQCCLLESAGKKQEKA